MVANISIPKVVIDATGCHCPALSDFLAYRIAAYQSVYGTDTYLGSDSQDGEYLVILAQADFDTATAVVAAYNAFAPGTAVGAGLSSVVKTNGLTRAVSSYSTVDVVVGGQARTQVPAGAVVSDGTNAWVLPAFTIGDAGVLTITATASVQGALTAIANTIVNMLTPYAGWQSVTNPAAAVPGAPVEQDGALRLRQSKSTALQASGLLQSVAALVLALPGVTAVTPYENVGNAIDANGLPGHSVSLVVTGGDAATVAAAIKLKMSGGCATYGTVHIPFIDEYGITRVTSFVRAVDVTITCNAQLTFGSKYTALVGSNVKAALAAYVTGLAAGDDVVPWDVASTLKPLALPGVFKLEGLTFARDGLPLSAADVAMAFYEHPVLLAANVTINGAR